MKKLFAIPLVVAILVVGLVLSCTTFVSANQDHDSSDIVGVWEVDAAAPYRPHLFTFNKDGTMLSTNPTNVQENPAQPHGGTNDSVGMGVWRVMKKNNVRYIVGTFEELNAFADNHQPADTLAVSFKVQLTNNGDGFDGPAVAKIGGDSIPSHLTGVRVTIDQSAVNGL